MGYMEMNMDANVQRMENRLRNLDLSHLTERLWAFLTIKKLLDERVRIEADEIARADLDAKILELSLKVCYDLPPIIDAIVM